MPYVADAELQDLFHEEPLRRSIVRIVDSATDRLKLRVKERTPVAKPPPGVGADAFTAGRGGRPPGTAKESWYRTDVDTGLSPYGQERFGADVVTDDPLMPLIEWPTRPHLIRPRLDRAPASVIATGKPRRAGDDPAARLRYVNSHGRVVYAREVHHPGTDGKHMMRDSLAELDVTWVDSIGADELERWSKEQLGLVK